MVWSLEIHHIGLPSSGDATLIIAKDTPAPTGHNPHPNPTIYSALIDGGRYDHRNTVHNYLTNTAQIQFLNVMIATHYDTDHFYGLRGLLDLNTNVYDDTFIFDQGEPGTIPAFNQGPYDDPNHIPNNRENQYSHYLIAIHSRGNRKRVTAFVDSNNTAGGNANWQRPNWLIGKEIFWIGANRYDSEGNYNPNGTRNQAGVRFNPAVRNLGSWDVNGDPIDTAGGNPLIPAGAPTIRCIAANQYRQGNAGIVGGIGGTNESRKNRKSLTFLVEFNNFKYFIGGDTEQEQENALRAILNPTNNFAGRVHAVKLSHHGAATSTSRTFIRQLRPRAVFISNGPRNSYGHPHQAVINEIEAISVHRGTVNGLLNYYLTGESDLGAAGNRPAHAVLDPNIAEVPGHPPGYVGGKHLKITVSHAQSMNPPTSGNNFTIHWQDANPAGFAFGMAQFRNH